MSQHWWNLSPSLAIKVLICFFKDIVLCVRKNFFKNKVCISAHVLMLKGVNFSSQVLALSFKVKGNKVSHTVSFDVTPSLIVWHKTWKSLCECKGAHFPSHGK